VLKLWGTNHRNSSQDKKENPISRLRNGASKFSPYCCLPLGVKWLCWKMGYFSDLVFFGLHYTPFFKRTNRNFSAYRADNKERGLKKYSLKSGAFLKIGICGFQEVSHHQS
jgi:hypothetical protein